MKTTRFVAIAAGVLTCVSGCGTDEKTTTKGELILALQTDMELPKDVDKVRIRVASYGNTVFSNDYPVGPNELRIPATLALFANPDRPTAPATIQVIGFRSGKPRVMRETVTTIPLERIASLRMPIEWLCDDSARADNGDVLSTCPTEQTCVAGTCTAAFVDSEELPDFKPEDVFGGGNGSGNGSCFDVARCFDNPTTLTVDTATCRATLPGDDPNLNIALKLPGMGDGICSDGVCLVPLDSGEGGAWSRVGAGAGSDQGAAIQLPQAVCDRLQAGKVESVIASKLCAPKTVHVPPCGPWSSAGGSGNTQIDAGGNGGGADASTRTDAGGPIDDGGSPSDATTRPDMTTGGDAGASTEAGPSADAGSGGKDGGSGEGGFVDGGCTLDTCGQPPLCQPPPPPSDGGVCMGVISTPAANTTSVCQWDVPGGIATTGMGFCPNLLNLQLKDLPGMPGLTPIPQVGEGQCGQNPGWQFIPSQVVVELCPASCAPVKGSGVGVQFMYGCPSISGPPDGGPGPMDGATPPFDAGGPADAPIADSSGPTDADAGVAPMVPILGGVFQIGCAPTDLACNADESPYHAVTLSDYSIDQTEVTQGAYDQCLRASVCVAPPCSSWQPSTKGNWPVTCVSWDEASNYCSWMGRRLPTEAEWEAAARGDMGDIYPWGITDPDCTVANFQLCSFSGPQSVRSFLAGESRYHAFDMAGNVAEWVFDWYGPYDGMPATNPTGPAAGSMRILRGGDFQSQASALRASHRQQMESVTRNDNVGFRCAKPGF